MAFLSADRKGDSLDDYIPAKQVERNITTSQLSDMLPSLRTEKLYVRVGLFTKRCSFSLGADICCSLAPKSKKCFNRVSTATEKLGGKVARLIIIIV